MKRDRDLDAFIESCSQPTFKQTHEKDIAGNAILVLLVYKGLKLIFPELKEWLELGGTAIALKREEIKKGLMNYAMEKELSYPDAEKSAKAISRNLDFNWLKKIVKALEKQLKD